MSGFWFFAGALLVVAVGSLLPFALGRGRTEDLDRNAQNIGIARDRLSELKADFDSGAITRDEFDEGKAELATALALDLDAGAGSTGRAEAGGYRHERIGAIVALLLLPLLSFGLYTQLGAPQGVSVKGPGVAGAVARAPVAATVEGADRPLPPISEMVSGLARKLEADPNNPDGWFMLGRSYAVMDNWQAAEKAYRQALALIPDQPDFIVNLAEAIGMTRDRDLSGEPARLLYRALTIDPNHERALWFLGLAERQVGNVANAVHLWRRLAATMADDDAARDRLTQLIADAERSLAPAAMGSIASMGAEAAVVAPEGGQAAEQAVGGNTGAGITVTVSLSPAMAARATPDQAVFIFARAVNGPPMPLAVVRTTVGALPTTVALTDAQAMMPAMKLSLFPEVTVGARVSQSGTAMPSSGDLFTEATPVVVADTPSVALVIDQVRR